MNNSEQYYERKINELKFKLREQDMKYKDLLKRYHKVADELLLIKAGKPIQRKCLDDNKRS